jgi:hypothetical protein
MSIRSPKIADGRGSCSGKKRRMRRSNGRKEKRREENRV